LVPIPQRRDVRLNSRLCNGENMGNGRENRNEHSDGVDNSKGGFNENVAKEIKM
jgi:hypothetical protein